MMDGKYVFDSFLQFPNIIHGISSKKDGSMKREDDKQIDREALSKFAKSVGITTDIVCMKQIHGGTVSLVENTQKLVIPETDSLITDKKNIPLAVLTADCLPIMFYDPTREAIGLAHAGYQGLLNHVIENTIHSLAANFKSRPHDIIVGIGPCIERNCYEVGEELIETFQKTFPSFENIFVEKKGKYYLDLRTIAEQALRKEDILKKHIEVMDICTKCDPNFYSYRGGDGDKRFVSLISLI